MSCGGECNAGDLRHRVTINNDTIKTQDAYGEQSAVKTALSEVWASVRPMQGDELESARQISEVVTHKIRIRYNAGVVPTSTIVFKSRTFEIDGILNYQERNIYLDLLCKEVV